MIQFRKKVSNRSVYANSPIIKVSKNTQYKFTLSELIIEKLNVDTEKHALMFGIENKQLVIFKEEKDEDNYHLRRGDRHNYRFRSAELYNFLADYLKIEKTKLYTLMMDDNFTLKLI